MVGVSLPHPIRRSGGASWRGPGRQRIWCMRTWKRIWWQHFVSMNMHLTCINLASSPKSDLFWSCSQLRTWLMTCPLVQCSLDSPVWASKRPKIHSDCWIISIRTTIYRSNQSDNTVVPKLLWPMHHVSEYHSTFHGYPTQNTHSK